MYKTLEQNAPVSSIMSNDTEPVLPFPEKNHKYEYMKSYRCIRCKEVYKFIYVKKCDSCLKLFCNDCINHRGKWLHSANNCDYCKGMVTNIHTIYFLCSSQCIDEFLKKKTRKRMPFVSNMCHK